MKTKFILPLLFFYFSISATTYHVLYLGNSLTYVNDVPALVNQIAISKGDTIVWSQNTPGGYQLGQHATNPTSLSLISAYKWDIVVIQAQSQQTAFPDGQLETDVYPACKFLVDSIHRNHPCTRVMYYMPAGWKYGDNMNCSGFPAICTYEGQFERIRKTHLNLIDSTEASIIPSGVSYRVFRSLDTTIDLWSSDNVHPSISGSYLTALNMYASFTQNPTYGSTYIPSGISPTNTARLQSLTDYVIFDSLSLWKTYYRPTSIIDSVGFRMGSIEWIPPYPLSYFHGFKILQDSTSDSIYYIINATDFNTTISNLIVPMPKNTTSLYVFLRDTFQCLFIADVTQVHIGVCNNKSTTQRFTILCLGIESTHFSNLFSLYPNPASDKIILEKKNNEYETYSIEIIDINGRKIIDADFEDNISTKLIDVSQISSGMYYVVLKDKMKTYTTKLIKE